MSETTVLTVEQVRDIHRLTEFDAGDHLPSRQTVMQLCDSHEALRAEVERLAQERDRTIHELVGFFGQEWLSGFQYTNDAVFALIQQAENWKLNITQAEAALAAMTAERDLQKRFTASAETEYLKVKERLAQIEALLTKMEADTVTEVRTTNINSVLHGKLCGRLYAVRQIAALLPVRGAGEEG